MKQKQNNYVFIDSQNVNLAPPVVYVFIDASNVWNAVKSVKKLIEYKTLKDYFRKNFNASEVEIFYFDAYPKSGTRDYDLDGKHKFFTYLKKGLGFTVRKKELKRISTISENGESIIEKGNMDVEITIDALHNMPRYNIAVFFSGDADFLAFSGHKMCGPTGIGVLYGKKELLEKMKPFLYGGDMISEVHFGDSSWNELPWKFEAGTPNIAGAIGLGAAIDYIRDIGMDRIIEYEEYLTEYLLNKLRNIENIIIHGPKNMNKRGPIVSFSINGIHPHDVSTILDREGIAIRGGHMCAMPLVTGVLGQDGVCRVSLYFYNNTEEIDRLISGIKKAKEIFKI